MEKISFGNIYEGEYMISKLVEKHTNCFASFNYNYPYREFQKSSLASSRCSHSRDGGYRCFLCFFAFESMMAMSTAIVVATTVFVSMPVKIRVNVTAIVVVINIIITGFARVNRRLAGARSHAIIVTGA